TMDTGSLFRHVLRTRPIPLGVQLLRALVRDATLFRKMLATLRYPSLEAKRTSAELVAIGVSVGYRRHGQAAAMVDVLNRKFSQMGVRRYTVAVYSTNAGAQAFYPRLGFRPTGKFSLYERAWVRFELDLATTAGRSRPEANARYPVRGTEA